MAECVFCVCAETRDVILRSVITKSHHQQLALHAYCSVLRGFCRSMCTGILFQMIVQVLVHDGSLVSRLAQV